MTPVHTVSKSGLETYSCDMWWSTFKIGMGQLPFVTEKILPKSQFPCVNRGPIQCEFCAGTDKSYPVYCRHSLILQQIVKFYPLNHLVEGQFNVAKCNLARWKHKTMRASGLCAYIIYVAGLGLFQGPSIFTALLGRSSHFTCIVFTCLLLPALPSLCVGLGKYLKIFHWGFQCHGTWWLPLTGLSWLPSRSLAAPSVYSGTFPTPIYWGLV